MVFIGSFVGMILVVSLPEIPQLPSTDKASRL